MRFQTRYDTWLVAVIIAVGLVIFGLPLLVYSAGALRGQQMWLFLIGPAVFVFVLLATAPQYYELREEGVFIRQGWKKVTLSYSTLRELSSITSVFSAPVFSTHRLLITTDPGGQYLIAVADEERFLAEVASRAPQLEHGSAGLRTRGRTARH